MTNRERQYNSITEFCKDHNLQYEEVEALCMMYAVAEGKVLEQRIKELTEELESIKNQRELKCLCKEEDKHGHTSINCCNECGFPIEEFWVKNGN